MQVKAGVMRAHSILMGRRAHSNTMPIPERLRLKPVSSDLVEELSELCSAIERELESGGTAEELLERWHRHSRRPVEPFEFRTYWKAVDQETFVREALNPPPAFDATAVYSEAIEVLAALQAVEVDESEEAYYLGWLEEQFPGGNMSDLIYWPDRWFEDASLFRHPNGAFKPEALLSNDQLVAYAMAVSGRHLSGAPDNVPRPFPVPKRRTVIHG